MQNLFSSKKKNKQQHGYEDTFRNVTHDKTFPGTPVNVKSPLAGKKVHPFNFDVSI